MDSLDKHRVIIRNVLTKLAQIPYSYGDLSKRVSFDSQNDSYAVITQGWDGGKRVHSCLIHVDIVEGKIWVQRDGTEDGVTDEFVAAGIPKDQIVLGFHAPEKRKFTGYANR